MLENPYQSPRFSGAPVDEESCSQEQARLSFRRAFVVLLPPAVYNYWAFDAYAMAFSYMPSDFATFYRAVNLAAFVIGATLIWFLGFSIIEVIAVGLRIVFATSTDRGAWQGVLYRSLNWAVFLAIPGAVLWEIWVFGFYQMGVNFYVISWAIGVPAHLLAAAWYVPLIYRWYRMTKSQSTH